MDAPERTCFADELKLQFNDIDQVQAQNLRGMITAWLKKVSGARVDNWAEDAMSHCKVSTHIWKDNRGSHKGYSFTWTGIMADAVLMCMPLSWHQHITYLHVKHFRADVSEDVYKEFCNRSTDLPMFRNTTKIAPKRAYSEREQVSVPTLRIGSNKSDLQFVIYPRARQPLGFEARFKDDKLKRILRQRIGANLDYDGNHSDVWSTFLETLANDGMHMVNKMAHECGIDPQSGWLGIPMNAAQLKHYFMFNVKPEFGINGELKNSKGFMPIPHDLQEDYDQRLEEFRDEFGLFIDNGDELDAN